MIELNKRLMNKNLWVKVTPIASYDLSKYTGEKDLSEVIYLCYIETLANKYQDYLAEKVLLDEYDQEEDVMKKFGQVNRRDWMKMKEAQFSKQVVQYLKEKGALVNVNTANMFDKVGRSDVECCYKGYWISLELKTGSYQPDPLQISYLQKVRDAGGFGLILRDNIQELMVLLSCIDNGIERQYKQPELPEIRIGEIEYD